MTFKPIESNPDTQYELHCPEGKEPRILVRTKYQTHELKAVLFLTQERTQQLIKELSSIDWSKK